MSVLRSFSTNLTVVTAVNDPRMPAPPVVHVGDSATRDPLPAPPTDGGGDGFVETQPPVDAPVIDEDLASFYQTSVKWLTKNWMYVAAALVVVIYLSKGKKA